MAMMSVNEFCLWVAVTSMAVSTGVAGYVAKVRGGLKP